MKYVDVAGTESAWDEWAAALLQNALQAAPLDFAGLWGVAVRFGINGLAAAGADARPLSLLLDLISEPSSPGTHFQPVDPRKS